MFRLLALVFLFLLACVPATYVYAREQAVVKVVPGDKYVRLFFYCKQPGAFSASVNGSKLKIKFNSDISVDALSIAASDDIQSANFDAANRTAVINLASGNYSLRKFTGEDFIGVDIIKPEGGVPVQNVSNKSQEYKETAEDASKKADEVDSVSVNPVSDRVVASEPLVAEIATIVQPTKVKKAPLKAKASEKVALHAKPSSSKLAKIVTPSPVSPAVIAKLSAISPAAEKPEEAKNVGAAVAASPVTPPETNKPVEAVKNVDKSLAVPVVAKEEPRLVKPAQPVAQSNTAAPALPSNAEAVSKAVENTEPALRIEKPSEVQTPNPASTIVAQPTVVPVQVEEEKKAADSSAETAVEEPETGVSENEEPDAAQEEVQVSVADMVKDKLLTKLEFEWKVPVASSVFKRAGYLWMVFDHAQNVDVNKIVNANAKYFSNGEQLKNRFYTILRLKLVSDINVVSYKEGENWIVGLVNDKINPAVNARIDMKFSDLLGSKVLLDSDFPIKPLRLIDAEVGDEIVVLPFSESGAGTKEAYKYVDFRFLETAQGAVIQVISDNVDVAVVDTGVAISGPSNRIANASQSALKELREKEEEARLRAERLKEQNAELTALKFTTWMVSGPKYFKQDLKDLGWKITESDWSDKNQHRLALARFYLVHGLKSEALGVINIMKEYDEKVGKTNDVKIVEGTALYMLGRYKEAADAYNAIKMDELSQAHRSEIEFWKKAAELQISNLIKEDKFINKNPLEKKDEDEGGADKVGNTKLMRDTSTRLLKMIRKMDPDFVNADELQKLEATARFVTNHYQEAIKRFEETDLYSSGDVFQAEDNKLWWSASTNRRADAAELPLLPNVETFLKNYPNRIFNDFALLAVEDALKRNDLAKAEEVLAAFREEDRLQQKDSIEFFRGLYFAKNEEDDKAISTWEKLGTEISDPYNRSRAKFAQTIFQLDKKKIDTKQAIVNLNSIRDVWRGGQLEFHILNLLGEFYMDIQKPMEGFKVWREAISAFPGSDEALLIARKMSEKFVKIFSQGEADKMPQIEAITLYYEFRELTPIGKLGDEMITKLVDRLINVDLLDRASALLTHQVRFRLVGEERDVASTKLIKIHLMNNDAQKALDVLDATENSGMNPDVALERRYLRSKALLVLGKSNKVLALLHDDYSKNAAFLRADVYWRNGVWRKVVDELEVPFREIRREDKKLNQEETNQVIKLAVAYALIERQKRLQILYEDFSGLIEDENKKKLLTFIATNKGPVDFHNLEQTVEYKDMERFLNDYMKNQSDAVAPTPSAQAEQPVAGAG